MKGSGLLSGDELNYHRFVQLASLVSLLGFTGLIVLQTNKKLSFLNFYFWLTLFIPLIISIWLNGKRHIVAFAFFILFMTLLAKGSIKGGEFLALALSIIISFGFFSYTYQTSLVRSIKIKEIYEISRLDFARDHLLKLSIYSELNPEKVKILDSRFQTVYNALIQYIPRFLWQKKPKIYDYKKYLVAAALKISVKDVIYGITGIWLGESLSNFGWMGILIGPFALSLFCRVGDATNDKFIMVFTSLTALVWFVLSLGAATHFLFVWLILMSRNMFSRNRFSKKAR